MRLSHEVRLNVAMFYLLVIWSQSDLIYVAIGSQFSLIYLANMSCSNWLRVNYEGQRQVCEGFETPWWLWDCFSRNFVAQIFWKCSKFSWLFCASLWQYEEITHHGDCFKNALWHTHECLSAAVAKKNAVQWDSGSRKEELCLIFTLTSNLIVKHSSFFLGRQITYYLIKAYPIIKCKVYWGPLIKSVSRLYTFYAYQEDGQECDQNVGIFHVHIASSAAFLHKSGVESIGALALPADVQGRLQMLVLHRQTASSLQCRCSLRKNGISNSYTMGCSPVIGDNPWALASGLSYVQVDKHGITILYHLHWCRPRTSWDISC